MQSLVRWGMMILMYLVGLVLAVLSVAFDFYMELIALFLAGGIAFLIWKVMLRPKEKNK